MSDDDDDDDDDSDDNDNASDIKDRGRKDDQLEDFQIDPKDESAFNAFMNTNPAPRKTLADLVLLNLEITTNVTVTCRGRTRWLLCSGYSRLLGQSRLTFISVSNY